MVSWALVSVADGAPVLNCDPHPARVVAQFIYLSASGLDFVGRQTKKPNQSFFKP